MEEEQKRRQDNCKRNGGVLRMVRGTFRFDHHTLLESPHACFLYLLYKYIFIFIAPNCSPMRQVSP